VRPDLRRPAAVLGIATVVAGFLLGFGRFLPVPVPPAVAAFLVEGTTRNVFCGFLLVAGGALLFALSRRLVHHGLPAVLAVGLYVLLCGLQPLLLQAAHRAIVAANNGRPVAVFYSPVAGAVVERDERAGTVLFQTTGGLISGQTFLAYTARPRGVMEGPHRTYGPHWVAWWGD